MTEIAYANPPYGSYFTVLFSASHCQTIRVGLWCVMCNAFDGSCECLHELCQGSVSPSSDLSFGLLMSSPRVTAADGVQDRTVIALSRGKFRSLNQVLPSISVKS
ncbi:hypothetical protein BDM02DRAFT_3123171 [Thelephora ganbajun]|uniref:Uncharacterized protein n=1 Tax=Thelephora ganbajun TaxID=370292 RepID=A0ACB6Z1Y1_THEGA|nr:hypothetical protein BDM02DRAFT_3123171 [Thelephora ganbajun]